MKEEFILDFDPDQTKTDHFGIEIQVHLRVNGRELFRSLAYDEKELLPVEDFTCPAYPLEFGLWFNGLVPRIEQPFPKREKAIFNWRMDHELNALGGGIIWPEIKFYGRNGLVFIESRPFKYCHPKNVTMLAYTECMTLVVSKRCFIDGVKSFCDKLNNTMSFLD